MDRRERLLGRLDLSTAKGLEIGPRDRPLVSKAEGPVSYVDYTDTASLRAAQFAASVDLDAIVDVDIVWGGQPFIEAVGHQVDYVVASHVVEHVPDFVGWLAEIHQVLKPGAILGLAVPDPRFTFDYMRRETNLSDVVAAYLSKAKQPSLAQVFDGAYMCGPVDVGAAWRGETSPDRRDRDQRLDGAWRLAKSLVENPRYQDTHCWVFTPETFLDIVDDLARLRLFPFVIEAFFATEPGGIEFQVRLSAAGAGDAQQITASIERARAALARAANPPSQGAAPASPVTTDEAELAHLRDEAAGLRAQIAALTASTSWRLTAPLRALVSALRR